MSLLQFSICSGVGGMCLWDRVVPWASLPCLHRVLVLSLGPCDGVSQDHLLHQSLHLPSASPGGQRRWRVWGCSARGLTLPSLQLRAWPQLEDPWFPDPLMITAWASSPQLHVPRSLCCWYLECVPPERRPVPRSLRLQPFPATGS